MLMAGEGEAGLGISSLSKHGTPYSSCDLKSETAIIVYVTYNTVYSRY